MKHFTLLSFVIFSFAFGLYAQESSEVSNPGTKESIPIIIGVQFQNFTMPGKDLGGHFKNPGIFAGTEVYYNASQTLFQDVTIGFYRNKNMGNGLHLTSQFGVRPNIGSTGFFAQLKGGIGVLRVSHPAQAYIYDSETQTWNTTTGGKTQLLIPFDISVGKSGEKVSPFLSYNITPALGYNITLPLNIYTNFRAGIRYNL